MLILIGLEGLLSTDNSCTSNYHQVLPEDEKRKAINHGIIMVFVFDLEIILPFRLAQTS